MQKSSSFASRCIKGWPRPEDIEHFFLAPPGQRWFFETGQDGAWFEVQGLDGTDHLRPETGRIIVTLIVSAHPTFGVMLQWSKWDGERNHTYYAKGDLRRLGQLVRDMHQSPLSVGLLVPFETAWKAVKEFLETDGQLPKSIEWIDDNDLPPDTFFDPANESRETFLGARTVHAPSET